MKAGDQVVCVDDSLQPFEVPVLKRGHVYTIRRIEPYSFTTGPDDGVWLEERRTFDFSALKIIFAGDKLVESAIDEIMSDDRPWGVRRFRPLKKSEIEHVQKLLAPVDTRELVDI